MGLRAEFQKENIRVFSEHISESSLADLWRDCRDFNVLGLDSEWVPARYQGDPEGDVALLQLATARGNIFLFRTCTIDNLPRKLIDLLQNRSILKVGLNIERDVQKLKDFYDVYTKGSIDLRYVAEVYDPTIKSVGLSALAESFLNVHHPNQRTFSFHSKWADVHLDSEHLLYAAKDAYLSLEVFKAIVDKLKPGRLQIPMQPINCKEIVGVDVTDQRYRKGAANQANWESASFGARPPHQPSPSFRAQTQGSYQEALEPQQQSENTSGMGTALAIGAGIAALGLLWYKSRKD